MYTTKAPMGAGQTIDDIVVISTTVMVSHSTHTGGSEGEGKRKERERCRQCSAYSSSRSVAPKM
jgi:hypothetical protein